MKFLVPNYSCLQNPWLRGYSPQIPVISVLCPQLNLLNPPRKKFLCTPLLIIKYMHHATSVSVESEGGWGPQTRKRGCDFFSTATFSFYKSFYSKLQEKVNCWWLHQWIPHPPTYALFTSASSTKKTDRSLFLPLVLSADSIQSQILTVTCQLHQPWIFTEN